MPKTAIIYDWMDKWGGVERLLLTLNEMYPEADWFTSYVDEEGAKWVSELRVTGHELKMRTSFLQKFPPFIRKNRILSLPFYPYAFESFDLTEYDLVISVTSSFAKGVITRPGTEHICILLTPTRWLWWQDVSKLRVASWKVLEPITWNFRNWLRKWDYVAAQRPDKIFSISQTVADRCQTYYKRDSEVLYPPFDMDYWENIKSLSSPHERRDPSDVSLHLDEEEYFLVVSRLESYKKVDLVVRAFNEMKDRNLVIVGKGTQKMRLQQLAGKNTQFIENVSDEELAQLYSGAQALIMPQEEDFGYVALEAQFFGCPVIAYKKGGVSETVLAGKTGMYFDEQSVGSVRDAVERFEHGKYNLEDSYRILEKFSKNSFCSQLTAFVDSGSISL